MLRPDSPKPIRPFDTVPSPSLGAGLARTESVYHQIDTRRVSIEVGIDQRGLVGRIGLSIDGNPSAPRLVIDYTNQQNPDGTFRLSERSHTLKIPQSDGSTRIVELRRELFPTDRRTPIETVDNQVHQFPLYEFWPRVGQLALKRVRVDELVAQARTLQQEKGDVFVENLPNGATQITFYRAGKEYMSEYTVKIDAEKRVIQVTNTFMNATADDTGFEKVYAAESSITQYYYQGDIPVRSTVSHPSGLETIAQLREDVPFQLVTSVTNFNGVGPNPIQIEQALLLCSQDIVPSETPIADSTVFESEQISKKDGVTTQLRRFKLGTDTWALVEVRIAEGKTQFARIELFQ